MGRQKTIIKPGSRDLGDIVNCTVPEFQWKFFKSANDSPSDFWIRMTQMDISGNHIRWIYYIIADCEPYMKVSSHRSCKISEHSDQLIPVRVVFLFPVAEQRITGCKNRLKVIPVKQIIDSQTYGKAFIHHIRRAKFREYLLYKTVCLPNNSIIIFYEMQSGDI